MVNGYQDLTIQTKAESLRRLRFLLFLPVFWGNRNNRFLEQTEWNMGTLWIYDTYNGAKQPHILRNGIPYLKIIEKRGYDLDLLDAIVNPLAAEEPLADKHYDHSLTGDYAGFCE